MYIYNIYYIIIIVKAVILHTAHCLKHYARHSV